MSVLCPRCDHEPVGISAGAACPACGTKLVLIASGEPPDELVGTTVDGRFEVTARLGRGGMGTVYRARQKSIDREVALKMIDRELEREVSAVKRFFREAQLASQLAHPNTVSVIEFGQDATGRMYMAMELVRGETLAALAKRDGALTLARIVRFAVQLCDALEAAHALGIVHRDLKLENVMVLDGGRDLVKVLDFGLARSLLDEGARATATGMIAGTPRYLAPEVALRGAAPAGAQDVYALGVMLGELATGHELWLAPTMEELFAKKAFGPPALDGVPRELEAILQRMLSVEAADRPTPAEARLAFQELDVGAPTRISTPSISIGDALRAPPAFGEAPTDASLGPIGPSRLVPLDDADARPPRLVAMPPPLPVRALGPALPPGGPPGLDELPLAPSEAFRGPDQGMALEVESEWAEARLKKQNTAVPSPIAALPKHTVRNAALALVGVVIVGVGASAAWTLTRHPPPPAAPTELEGLPNTVGIHIVAPSPVQVRVDGTRAGKTPMTLNHKRTTRPLVISADGSGAPVMRQIVPDHDQTVDLDPDVTP